jgi:hypothetical protein
MAVLAPTLTSIADDLAGTTVTLTVTPPATGDYDHCQILYRERGSAVWSVGATYVGAPGVGGTVQQTGLTPGVVHDFIVYAQDSAGAAGPPSVQRSKAPTAGTGTIQERIVADLVAALEGILESEGYWDDVEAVHRAGHQVDLEIADHPVAFVREDTIDHEQEVVAGVTGILDQKHRIMVAMVARRAADDVLDWPAAEAGRMDDAIRKAVLADRTRGGLAIDTRPVRSQLNPSGVDLGDAVTAVEFEVWYRVQTDNPSVKQP